MPSISFFESLISFWLVLAYLSCYQGASFSNYYCLLMFLPFSSIKVDKLSFVSHSKFSHHFESKTSYCSLNRSLSLNRCMGGHKRSKRLSQARLHAELYVKYYHPKGHLTYWCRYLRGRVLTNLLMNLHLSKSELLEKCIWILECYKCVRRHISFSCSCYEQDHLDWN